MSKDLVSLDGRRHPLVKEFQPFFEGLEKIVGKEGLGLGPYQPIRGGPREPEYEFRGLDDNTNRMRVTGRWKGYSQDFSVDFRKETAGELQGFLKEYGALR